MLKLYVKGVFICSYTLLQKITVIKNEKKMLEVLLMGIFLVDPHLR